MHTQIYVSLVQPAKRGADIGDAELAAFRRLPHIVDAYLWRLDGNAGSSSPPGFFSETENTNAMREAWRGRTTAVARKNAGMVILVPLTGADRHVEAVVGLLESDDIFRHDVRAIRSTIALAIAAAGLVLYLALFGLFYRAQAEQKRSTAHLKRTFDVIVFAMSSLSSLRDHETGGHLERTAAYASILLNGLRRMRKYHAVIDVSLMDAIVTKAPLHDIGKVGVEDAILRKPGRLDPTEFEAMKRHTVMGSEILASASRKLPFRTSLSIASTSLAIIMSAGTGRDIRTVLPARRSRSRRG